MSKQEVNGLCNVMVCEGIVKGTVVVLDEDGNIVYAGPIKQSPILDGLTAAVGTEDFKLFKQHLDKHRH